MRLGNAAVWVSGNDVYNRLTLIPSVTCDRLQTIGKGALRGTGELLEEAGRVRSGAPASCWRGWTGCWSWGICSVI